MSDLLWFTIPLNHITVFHICTSKYLFSHISCIVGFTDLFSLHRQIMNRAFISPISRLKEVIIGSSRRGSFIRGNASTQR
uniref:Uncharacterized protein n=1 Tax=Solanum tuberosum TaxID=4113 RepID=M1A7Z4_SOLTU